MNRGRILLVAALGLFTLVGSAAQAQVPNPYLEGVSPSDLNNMLTNSLGSIDDSYRGMHQHFNDDVIGNLFDKAGQVVLENVLKPFWNGLMEKNPLCVVVAIVLAGFLLRWGAKLFDAFDKVGQQTSTPAEQK